MATPDALPNSFQQNQTSTYSASRGDLDVVFVENLYDPDPSDETYEATILYLIRQQGQLRIETDHWTLGLFALDTWRQLLQSIGFHLHEEEYRQDEDSYTVFACVRQD